MLSIYRKLLVQRRRNQYRESGYDYRIYYSENKRYCFTDDYLNWGNVKNYNVDGIQLREDGVPLINYNGKYCVNPCTLLQFTLKCYGDYLAGRIEIDKLNYYVDLCLDLMDGENKITYPFDFPYYCDPQKYYSAGWSSSMDYGHLLSICARMYNISHDDKYVRIADKCLNTLVVPINKGGVCGTLAALKKKYKDFIIFEEYPHIPETYTLNGFEYCLLGLYDWSCTNTDNSDIAESLFNKGIESLMILLPYYDIGGFTCYDLSYRTIWRRFGRPHVSAGYHREHIFFNKIFYDITGKDIFHNYYLKWKSYVD